ncbi:hypothetical protein MTQ89_03450 [Staphylococcus hyicus]|uniref:hypothetical protein n=1 Tax=Staphylococcus hyicus TaxID=1284 RepID=UPI00208FF580|nr:hypothetical protein [Staphylococcus hyicus]MCO4330316.1 hypothetical protein [Staphylococcus hyicus]MCO4335838.1 hypothetical protein [Staphylococcus hyicus]
MEVGKAFNKNEFPMVYSTKIIVEEVTRKIRDGKHITLREVYVLTYLESILTDNANSGLLMKIHNLLDNYNEDN